MKTLGKYLNEFDPFKKNERYVPVDKAASNMRVLQLLQTEDAWESGPISTAFRDRGIV